MYIYFSKTLILVSSYSFQKVIVNCYFCSFFLRENEQCALNLDDVMCSAIVRAIKSFTDIADPMTTDSAEYELSTPDNGVEPVSIVSHLAEQEQSISDDSARSVTSPMLEYTTEMTKVTPSLEHRLETYAEDFHDDEEAGMAVIGNNGTVYITEAHAETVSVDTTHDVGEDVYQEEGMG
jgi:hypothetical protein